MADNDEEAKKEAPAIFLNDISLMGWERPVKPGYFRLPRGIGGPDPETRLVSFLDIGEISEKAGDYKIITHAVSYLADVARWNFNKFDWDENARPENLSREGLLSGVVAVFRRGIIPGTKIDGYDLVKSGEIWFASKTLSDVPSLPINIKLHSVIFGDTNSESDRVGRVEAIVRGYEIQEESEARAESRLRHSMYQQGRGDADEEHFGTFGRR